MSAATSGSGGKGQASKQASKSNSKSVTFVTFASWVRLHARVPAAVRRTHSWQARRDLVGALYLAVQQGEVRYLLPGP